MENNCEICDAPFKTLYRVKWELFHLRWMHICKNCGKKIKQVYGDALIYGGNANYPIGFFNVKKRILFPRESPAKKYFLVFRVNANSV